MSDAFIWTIIAGLGIGTFLIRFSFLGIIGDRPLPEWVIRHLRYISVGVLPALVAPLVLWPAATGGAPDAPRIIAALVALGAGVWLRNMLVPVLLAMGALYLGIWLQGGF